MSQIMTEQELHEAGLELLLSWLQNNGNEIEMAQPQKEALPHIVIKSGRLLTFIAVATAMYPHKGQVSEADRTALYEHAQKFGAFCAIASIGLANAAGIESRDKKLLGTPYKDASFVMDFGGLQYLGAENAQKDASGK